jgi:hypothetical protein
MKMGYQLGIDVPNSPPHPAFPFDTMEEACTAANAAIDNGYLKIAAQGVTIQTGPGTVYKMISDEHMQKQSRGEEPPLAPYNFVLLVGLVGGQIPLGYHSEESMRLAVETVVLEKILRHCTKEGHEYTYIEGRVGLVWMEMTKTDFLRKQHALAVEMQKQAQEAEANKSRIHSVR